MTHYTSTHQSEYLLHLGLSPATADMYFALDAEIAINTSYITILNGEKCVPAYKGAIPCWSLGALIDLLPERIHIRDWVNYKLVLEKHKVSYVRIEDLDEYSKIFCWFEDEDLLDAVFEMTCLLLDKGYIKKGGES